MSKSLIVVVDDDETMVATVGRCLRREPSFEVRTTISAREALAWIASEPVAVLVSDYEMPEMTGAQLAGQAKRVRPETVRILLTGRRTSSWSEIITWRPEASAFWTPAARMWRSRGSNQANRWC